ncbi:MAG: methylmalonyl-CoA epimerase [Selenomonadales bacterium]|nr:methylmalonyl-CoA epimerase [Selenomonadales bacterium]
MLEKIDHLGIAVRDLNTVLAFYTDKLGLPCTGEEVVAEQKVRVAFLPLGQTKLELLESTAPDGPVAKFIEQKGEGIHHVAIRVANIEEALASLKAKGVRLIDEKPRIGAHGAKIAFIHPKESHGVLIELCERCE